MLRNSVFTFFFFLILSAIFSQETTAEHEIIHGSELNEYIVKTTIKGLKDADIARATYKIDNVHTYKKIESNELFSYRNKEHIKFYVMGVPESGIITVELGLILKDNSDYSFPVEFQYARNDENIIVQFSELVFPATDLLAVIEEPIAEFPTKKLVSIAQKNDEEIKVEEVVEVGKEIVKEEERLAKEKTEAGVLVIKIAEQKAKQEAEAAVKKVADEKVADEKVADEKLAREKVPTIKEELADTKVKYTIQILSLSKFSKARFDAYCKKHSLLEDEVSTRIVNGVTKVIYGKANSLEEAKKIIDKLKLLNNIDAAFAVPL